jgi:very-long-chain (3R)-3-hydroxyacyl-CoA dehydratase
LFTLLLASSAIFIQNISIDKIRALLTSSTTPIGIVRAPVATTFLQISSRIILVWIIINPFPYLAKSAFYSSMLIAWSVTEVVRYSYFVCTLSGYNPGILTWLRYSMFYVLYPLGISSEYWNIWNAVKPAGSIRQEYAWVLQLLMFMYWPCKHCVTLRACSC